MFEKIRSWRDYKTTDVIAAVILIVCLTLVFLNRPDEVVGVASSKLSAIDLGKVTCVSIGPHDLTTDERDTSDPRLAKSIVDILSIKTVFSGAAYSECPWGFFADISSNPGDGVRDGDNQPAEYRISVGICERADDGHLNRNKCLSKYVYVFDYAKTHDMFKIGLVGLKGETPDMRTIRVKSGND